jgi:hypothetical protein
MLLKNYIPQPVLFLIVDVVFVTNFCLFNKKPKSFIIFVLHLSTVVEPRIDSGLTWSPINTGFELV